MLNRLLGDDYATPDQANGKCWQASNALASALRQLGIDVQMVECNDFLGDPSEWHPWYEDNGFVTDGEVSVSVGHWMIRVGTAYIDVTAKQFFPDADCPQVYREEDMDAMWGNYKDYVG